MHAAVDKQEYYDRAKPAFLFFRKGTKVMVSFDDHDVYYQMRELEFDRSRVKVNSLD